MLPKYIKFLLTFAFSSILIFAFGQKSDRLKNERNSVKAEIEKTASEIQTTSKARKTTYQQYLDLKATVGTKQEMINELKREIELMNFRITRQEEITDALAVDLELMKDSYGELLRKAYRQSQSNQPFLFLFSAESFNDFAQRWRFLKQYHDFKKREARLIRETQSAFEIQNKALQILQTEKTEIIEHFKTETEKLSVVIQEKEKVVKELSQKEKKLKIKLSKQEKAKENLNSDIEKAIFAELKTERAKNRTPQGLKTSETSKKEVGLSLTFQTKKGSLPMPVSGKIVGKFGIRVHSEAHNTKTESPGIEIETNENASVRVVYDGKVVRSFFKPEFQNIVLVQHGDYFTLYSNLKSVVVKTGNIVKEGDILGKVGTKNGKTELHFQIWQNGTKLNPEDWF